jgi:hypothetical protein
MRSSIQPLSRLVWFGLLLLALGSRECVGQRVFGRALDKQTLEPVSFTQLLLIRPTGDTLRAVTDSRGMYSFALPTSGRHRLLADRIGYERVETASFELSEDEQLQLDIVLSPKGVPLDPIVVVGSAGLEPGRFGFERRCATRNSWCLNRDSLPLRQPVTAAEMFRGVEGIMVKWSIEGSQAVIKSFECLQVFLNHSTEPIATSGNVFRTRDATVSWHWSAIDPQNVIGIELYHDRKDVPKELLGGLRMTYTFSCGVAIIWTKAAW